MGKNGKYLQCADVTFQIKIGQNIKKKSKNIQTIKKKIIY